MARSGLFPLIEDEVHSLKQFSEQNIRQPRFHNNDVRVIFAFTLLVVLCVIIAYKVHYASTLGASSIGFRDMCSIDQLFDPIISFTGGSLTAVIGFYFGERAR